MPATLALHITPCRSVHTFGMRFALDLIWLDRAGAVVRVDRGVRAAAVADVLGARGRCWRCGRVAASAFASAQRDGDDPEQHDH